MTRWRFLSLRLAISAAHRLGARLREPWPQRARDIDFAPGVSVLIPERGTPDLLADTLAAAEIALQRIEEPGEIVVVVNGAPQADYAALQARHPAVRWSFHAAALGYNGAVVAGLALVRHDWTYLLNSDMTLAPDALRALLPYRQPQVYGICSQIFFADATRRREETGWSDFHPDRSGANVYEREPEPGAPARGTLYAGGGSSLCRTALLRRYAAESGVYNPFYWEDAEWGARAWYEGWEAVFCPESRAVHQHRGTVRRYYEPAEVERVIRRNALQFDLRHDFTLRSMGELLGALVREPEATQRELCGLGTALAVYRQRSQALRARRRGLDLALTAPGKFYRPRPFSPQRPRVLLVSPFALFPPAHGGARRVWELVRRLSDEVDFILLCDERTLHDERSWEGFAHFRAVHLMDGRGDLAGEGPLSFPARLQRHAHPRMRGELRRLVASYRPDIVQIEFMELARLVEERDAGGARWLLALHDVYLGGGDHDALQRPLIEAFDLVTACSREDLALLESPRARLVANGAPRYGDYVPSPAAPELLFMGPFRYRQNREGILCFLEQAWPAIRAAVPEARLTILGGAESAADRNDPRLNRAGVALVSEFVDPAPRLSGAALTLNPQLEIRGSALKVAESLLAGRVCVSTRDGARGFADDGASALVIADDIASMAAPTIALLRNVPERHRLERPTADIVARYGWDGIAQAQLALYRELMQARA
jgi:GT2 family glycosyltransferase/glycosyltransferase involved in cell wall biosynthesis